MERPYPYYNALPEKNQAIIQKEEKNTLIYTVKKRLAAFPSPAGMSLTKLPLGRE
jgi:hypothetical protein